MDRRYQATLDIFSLISLYPEEASVLASQTVLAALRYIERQSDGNRVALLLRLARDLGYVSDELFKLHTQFLPAARDKL
jgi:hypothetical protein